MKQCTHFIEQYKHTDGTISNTYYAPIRILKFALKTSPKYGFETIAIFKIYPHPKPAIAHYDYDLKTMIVE